MRQGALMCLLCTHLTEQRQVITECLASILELWSVGYCGLLSNFKNMDIGGCSGSQRVCTGMFCTQMPKAQTDGPGTMTDFMPLLTSLAESSCILGVRVFEKQLPHESRIPSNTKPSFCIVQRAKSSWDLCGNNKGRVGHIEDTCVRVSSRKHTGEVTLLKCPHLFYNFCAIPEQLLKRSADKRTCFWQEAICSTVKASLCQETYSLPCHGPHRVVFDPNRFSSSLCAVLWTGEIDLMLAVLEMKLTKMRATNAVMFYGMISSAPQDHMLWPIHRTLESAHIRNKFFETITSEIIEKQYSPITSDTIVIQTKISLTAIAGTWLTCEGRFPRLPAVSCFHG